MLQKLVEYEILTHSQLFFKNKIFEKLNFDRIERLQEKTAISYVYEKSITKFVFETGMEDREGTICFSPTRVAKLRTEK